MIEWIFFPASVRPPSVALDVVTAFEQCADEIDSLAHRRMVSDAVLANVADALAERGFEVERGKKKAEKIYIPVLFGRQGEVEKSFDADAVHWAGRMVLEVEAGRGVVNNQFLKDLFQACMMQDIDYLGIAVRREYEVSGTTSKDFERVLKFFETLYASSRLHLPLKGILLIGY